MAKASVKLLVSFTVAGVAQSRGSKSIGRKKDGTSFVRDSNRKSGPWMRTVEKAARVAMQAAGKQPTAKPVKLVVTVYRERPKGHFGTGKNAAVLHQRAAAFPQTYPDITKVVRGIEDAMNEVVWIDDAQVTDQDNRKRFVEHETWEAYAAKEIAAGRVPKPHHELWGRPRVVISVYELPATVADAYPQSVTQRTLAGVG